MYDFIKQYMLALKIAKYNIHHDTIKTYIMNSKKIPYMLF